MNKTYKLMLLALAMSINSGCSSIPSVSTLSKEYFKVTIERDMVVAVKPISGSDNVTLYLASGDTVEANESRILENEAGQKYHEKVFVAASNHAKFIYGRIENSAAGESKGVASDAFKLAMKRHRLSLQKDINDALKAP